MFVTQNHHLLASVGMVILAVSPVNLRELIEQMEGVLKKETLLVSILAGVTRERLSNIFDHDLVVRTMVDARRFPVKWSRRTRAKSEALLLFQVEASRGAQSARVGKTASL
jgi:hypothetical protein